MSEPFSNSDEIRRIADRLRELWPPSRHLTFTVALPLWVAFVERYGEEALRKGEAVGMVGVALMKAETIRRFFPDGSAGIEVTFMGGSDVVDLVTAAFGAVGSTGPEELPLG